MLGHSKYERAMKFRLFKIDHSQDTAESITKVSDKKEILNLKINAELLGKSLQHWASRRQ